MKKIFTNKGLKHFIKKNDFVLVIFPNIHRVYARLLSPDIIPIEPMTIPSGMIYYFDPGLYDEIQYINILNRKPMSFHWIQKI